MINSVFNPEIANDFPPEDVNSARFQVYSEADDMRAYVCYKTYQINFEMTYRRG
jgi:hypothetical protein